MYKRQTLDTVTRNEIQQGSQVIYAPKLGADGGQTAVLHRYDLTAVSYTHLDVYKRQIFTVSDTGTAGAAALVRQARRMISSRCV